MKILAFDPSGNFAEGKGTSGWCTSVDGQGHILGDINSQDYATREAYWAAHAKLINEKKPDYIVIESYKLFGHKAKSQSGSSLETPQLIGYLQMIAYGLDIPVILQDPSTKSRHSDTVLTLTGTITKSGIQYYFNGEKTNMHKRDALRHNMYFFKYGKKEKK